VTFFRGLSYLGKVDETRGFADFDKAMELEPDSYWYRYQRGLEYAKRGQLDAALADADKAIALKGDDRDS
jgi:tetratricopeptide (TPR) repeat protein